MKFDRTASRKTSAVESFLSTVTVCGSDLNTLLGYRTIRRTTIRDFRLGLLHLIIQAAVVAYAIISLFSQKTYYKYISVSGSVRMTLKAPESQFQKSAEELKYCGNGTFESAGSTYPQYECLYYSPYRVVYPTSEDAAMLVTTRMKTSELKATDDCARPTEPECLNGDNELLEITFLAQVENYTLLIDHSMSDGRHDDIKDVSGNELGGRMVDEGGNEVDVCEEYMREYGECPSYISMGEPYHDDIISLYTLLKAGGISDLEDASDVAEGETARYAGVVFEVDIVYSNTYSFDQNSYRYTIAVNRIVGAEYKAVEIDYNSYFDTPVEVGRSGIRIIVKQSGEIGVFSFQVFLVNTVSALGLLAIGTFVVDYVSITCMSESETYKKVMVKEFDRKSALNSPPSSPRYEAEKVDEHRLQNLEQIARAETSSIITTPRKYREAKDSPDLYMLSGPQENTMSTSASYTASIEQEASDQIMQRLATVKDGLLHLQEQARSQDALSQVIIKKQNSSECRGSEPHDGHFIGVQSMPNKRHRQVGSQQMKEAVSFELHVEAYDNADLAPGWKPLIQEKERPAHSTLSWNLPCVGFEDISQSTRN